MGSSPSLLVRCDVTMLMVCADYINPVYIHRSEKYLFLDDQSTNEVPFLYISLPLKKLIPSGASIPGSRRPSPSAQTGCWYAVEGSDIFSLRFQSAFGIAYRQDDDQCSRRRDDPSCAVGVAEGEYNLRDKGRQFLRNR
jgi:hypothetical protein